MNKREFMNEILELCSEKQKGLFSRMYPNGPTDKQLKTAIFQIKNTLTSGNKDTENLKLKIIELEEYKESQEAIHIKNNKEISDLKQEVESLKTEVELLKNPINTENVDVQKQLMRLQALEYGGVDNWEWYGESISNYEKEYGVEL